MKGTIVLKVWMGLTGLFLVLFLVVHMLGNLQLFLPASTGRLSFNAYSHALGSNPFIQVAGWVTYGSIAVHAGVGGVFAWRHRAARQPYALERAGASSPWFARSMGWLGVVTLGFLVLHLQAFWYRYHWGEIGLDSEGHKDLYTVVVTAFREPWVVAVYVGCMIALGFHLQHGLAASLRSLGVFGARVNELAPRVSTAVAWVLAGGFAAMPIYIYVAFAGGAGWDGPVP